MWHRDGLAPLPSLYLFDFQQVPGSNPEDNLFCCNLFRVCPLQERCKFSQRSRADEIERRNLLRQLFIAADEHPSALSPRSRMTSARKVAFLMFDSMRI